MTRFDANHTQGQLSTESQDPSERMEADEEAEAQLSDYDMAGISDNEELESETEYVSEADNMDAHDRDASPGLQDPGLPLDQETLDQETLDQEIDSVELPNHHPIVRIVQSDSQRPHRERKRRRDDDEYVYTKRTK